jgi:hypothetical protein
VTQIGEFTFQDCTSLTSINIPESVTKIGTRAFNSCSSLECIKVDDKNKIYDSRNNCNAIIHTASNTLIEGCNKTIIPDSVTQIEDGAFEDCESLTSINIPEGVTQIEAWEFRGCTSLTSITIPDSVTEIGYEAFIGCEQLKSVSIAAKTHVDSSAFSGCPKVKKSRRSPSKPDAT